MKWDIIELYESGNLNMSVGYFFCKFVFYDIMNLVVLRVIVISVFFNVFDVLCLILEFKLMKL